MDEAQEHTFRRRKGPVQIRFLLFMLMFVGTFLVYAMRFNLSVAIIAMTGDSGGSASPNSSDTCRPDDHTVRERRNNSLSRKVEGDFAWDKKEQATIMYSFFIGYLITQIPGGYLAEAASATWVFGLGVGLTSLLTCFTSIAAYYDYYALIALRICEGIAEGVTFPAVFAFIARWSPSNEQNVLLNFVNAGAVVGTIVTLPVSALLCASPLGWPASFYTFGGIGILWTLIWLCVARDCPEKHPWISVEENKYIVESRSVSFADERPTVPWAHVLLSPAVLVLGIAKLAGSLNYYMMLTEVPTYLNDMYAVNIVDNGWINGGMNLSFAIIIVFTGRLSDKLIERQTFDKTRLRKAFVLCSQLIPSAWMFLLAYIGCNYDLVMVSLVANCIFLGFAGGGDAAMALDIAPRFAGVVAGVVNMIANIAGLAAPILVGYLTEDNNTLTQWNNVFFYTAVVTIAGLKIFLILGTAEEQSWAKKVIAEEDGDFQEDLEHRRLRKEADILDQPS